MTDQIIKTLRDIPVDAMRRASLAYAIQVLRATGEAGTESACLLLEQHIDELRDASPSAFPDPYADAGPDVVDWKRGSVFHKIPPPSEAALKIIGNGSLRDERGVRCSSAERLAAELRDGTATFVSFHVEGAVNLHDEITGDPEAVARRVAETVRNALRDAVPDLAAVKAEPDLMRVWTETSDSGEEIKVHTAATAALEDLEGRAPTDVVITDELVREFRDAYAAQYAPKLPPTYSRGCTIPTIDRYLAGARDKSDCERIERCVRTWLKYDKSFRRG